MRLVRIDSCCMNFTIFYMQFKKYLFFFVIEMNLLRQDIKQGEVYRRSDLEYYTTAIDRSLAQLTKDGTFVILNHGLYYKPKQSIFGAFPPVDRQKVY